MTRPAFAKRLGVSPEYLASKEYGRVPLREEELDKIKAAVAAHLVQSNRAFAEAFGHDPATVTQ